MTRNKGRAAATAHGDHPAKENLHKQDCSKFYRRMQAVSPFVNGLIMRTVCHSRLLFTAVSDMQETMDIFFGIRENEFWLSVDYLTKNGYLTQFIDGQSTIFRGDQLKLTAQGVRLLAGTIKDDKVDV